MAWRTSRGRGHEDRGGARPRRCWSTARSSGHGDHPRRADPGVEAFDARARRGGAAGARLGVRRARRRRHPRARQRARPHRVGRVRLRHPAAALGGVTTIVDMPLNSLPPTTTVPALEEKREASAGELHGDVGFWGGAVPGNVDDLEPLWEAGVFGFKCFLADSGVDEFPPLGSEQFLDAMAEIARFGGLMIVHAEDAGGARRVAAPAEPRVRGLPTQPPRRGGDDGDRQVLDGVRETGARMHMLHLSSARALDLIAEAKAEGLPVTVETCPHYLCFDAEHDPRRRTAVQVLPADPRPGQPRGALGGARAGSSTASSATTRPRPPRRSCAATAGPAAGVGRDVGSAGRVRRGRGRGPTPRHHPR